MPSFCSTCLRTSVAWHPSQGIQTPSGTRFGSKCPCQAFFALPSRGAMAFFLVSPHSIRGCESAHPVANFAAAFRSRSRAIAQEHGGDLNPFKATARPVFVEMDAWLAFQITSNHGGQRLTDYQPDRLVVMPLEQRPRCRLDSPHRAFDRLAQRWTDGFGVIDPLAKQLCVAPADF